MIRPRPPHGPQWRGVPLQAVLFDLDGTLLDTVDDIAAALNLVLAEQGLRSLPAGEVRHMIGRGAAVLIARALARNGPVVHEAGQAAMLERFVFHYGRLHQLGESSTRAYPGAAEALADLHDRGLRLAVVTNKHQRLATELLQHLGLSHWVDLVVGAGSCERSKPDPQPLLFACEALGVPAAQVLMVGDSVNDVTAARAAGVPVLCVLHGYNEGADPRSLPCDGFIEHLGDLPALLSGLPGAQAAPASPAVAA